MKRQAQYPAPIVMTDIVINAKIMPLAGDHHIVVAVITHLGWLTGQVRHNRTGTGQRIALTFLAAETAAHTPGFHPHGVHCDASCVRNFVLYLGGMLGRGIDQHIPVFAR